MTDGLKDAHREAIIATIAATDRVERAVLFGSRATGTNTVSSDVDIALFGDRLTLTDQARLAAALDEIPMAQSVDLLLHDSIQDRTLREHIRRQGIEWYARPTRDERSDISPESVSEWPIVTVEDLSEKVAMGPFGSSIKVSTFVPNGVPIISGQHLRGVRVDDSAGFNFITHEHAKRLANANVHRGDVIFTHAGNIGQVAYVPECSRFDRYVVSQRQFYLRCDSSKAIPEFVALYFTSDEGQHQLLANASQVGVPSIARPVTYLRTLQIPLPPLSEQRIIAHILGTLDDKIELNRRMNATLEAMARALFRSWFVDFDPVRAKMEGRDTGLPKDIADLFPDRLVDSDLGEIPEGWQLKPLDSVACFQNGLALQKFRPSQNEARMPVVKIAQLRAGESNSGEWASATIKPECIIENGDVVFSWSGSLLVRTWCGGRAALNQHLFKVTSKRYPKWFYLHSILSHFPEFQRIAKDKATTMGHIRRHHLTDALCVVPPDRVIVRVSDMLGGLLERQVANEVAIRILVALRDTLLPRLVSGELRVNAPEPACRSDDRPALVEAHGA